MITSASPALGDPVTVSAPALPEASAAMPEATVSPRRAALLVLALMAALSLSFVDRQILALLVEPIKSDLTISDTWFGVLQGLAFALFYIGFGIPLGRLADRGNRRNLMIAGIILWSIMTMACGTATSFAALFAWRAGVGIGEAALSPAAYSMIADAVPKRRLAFALGVYNMGVYLGSGLALLAGGALLGWLSSGGLQVEALRHVAPWRVVFVFVGLPGFAMAAILLLIREPRRTHFTTDADDAMPTMGETMRFVLSERKLFGGMICAFACHNTVLYALLNWIPAFLGRHHGLTPAQIGTTLGFSTIVGGGAGLILGGVSSDRMFAAGRADTPFLVAITSMTGIAATTLCTVYARSPAAAGWWFGLEMVFVALPIGTAAAALQLIVPNRFRGQVSALYLVCISLAGLSIGPIVPPFISDMIFHDPGRIGDSLAITVIVIAAASIALFLLARPAYARRYASIHLTTRSGDLS